MGHDHNSPGIGSQGQRLELARTLTWSVWPRSLIEGSLFSGFRKDGDVRGAAGDGGDAAAGVGRCGAAGDRDARGGGGGRAQARRAQHGQQAERLRLGQRRVRMLQRLLHL